MQESPNGTATPTASRKQRRGPVTWLLDLFSNVRFGICLLTILFIYSAIGSAGFWYPINFRFWSLTDGYAQLHIRQMRGLEMTEFEWFHWWPFDLLIALICLCLIVVTLRRIPFKPTKYGVWMVHTGLVTLAIGSVIYFTTKVEGDSPIIRRQVHIALPDGVTVDLPAIPGNSAAAMADGKQYLFEIWEIDPGWEILSGDDAGKRAYSVTVRVDNGEQMFLRQILDGYPEYTEDIVRSDDPQQPFKRAKRFFEDGRALVNEDITMSLDYLPQQYIYLANNLNKSWALYLREPGTTEWTQRTIEGVPLYNDYIVSRGDVWLDDPLLEPSPLNVRVPAAADDDPMSNVDFTVTSYLRHAVMETRRDAGGTELNPYFAVRLGNDRGAAKDYELFAFDPQRSFVEGGRMRFVWIDDEDELEPLREVIPSSLRIQIPAADVELNVPITETLNNNPSLGWTEIDGTAYAYRVESFQDNLQIGGSTFSVAMVQIRNGERSFLRWVIDDPSLIRDLPIVDEEAADDPMHQQQLPLDENIVMRYAPGKTPSVVTIVAGPREDQLRMLYVQPDQTMREESLRMGIAVDLDRGVRLTPRMYAARSSPETRPYVIPPAQRDPDFKESLSMIKLVVPAENGTNEVWLPFNLYPLPGPNFTMRRFGYQPQLVDVFDGQQTRQYEMLFSRQRVPLPTEVVLDDFEKIEHTGGFSGATISIRDWISFVSFRTPDGWTDPQEVRMNKPSEFGGFWYFQAQWDPPSGARFDGDRPSAGLNYTVLGVGNRNGVFVQLVGCCIAVMGMLYAFYIKPIIRRRERQSAYAAAELAATRATGARQEASVGAEVS